MKNFIKMACVLLLLSTASVFAKEKKSNVQQTPKTQVEQCTKEQKKEKCDKKDEGNACPKMNNENNKKCCNKKES